MYQTIHLTKRDLKLNTPMLNEMYFLKLQMEKNLTKINLPYVSNKTEFNESI